ncbi:MAG: hypothetical protein KGK07_15750, partial [Chloroflexota bacterium]|nr:hypothetical protein [Chloroflexota bacterium]
MFVQTLGAVIAFAALAAGAMVSGASAQVPGVSGSAQPAPAASISGRVTYTDGSPAVRRVVEWRPLGNPNGGSTVLTNSEGMYTITGLAYGVYFVGFFHPSRVPVDRNPGIERIPEAVSPALDQIGAPVGKRVVVAAGASATGVDFVITNIGNETVEGPATTGADLGLPSTGSA